MVFTSLVQQAREHLASRLRVGVEEIDVEFVEAVTWHDASLGCPREGRTYEKVETKGSIIGLAYGGRTFEYHADQRKVFWCEGLVTR
jgi:hypothetical protein